MENNGQAKHNTEDVSLAAEQTVFGSGAASSKQQYPHHLVPTNFVQRVAQRFGLGKTNYGDINYMKAVTRYDDTNEVEIDVEFARDRWNHAVDHLLNVKTQPWLADDNLAAVAWFAAMAMRFEEMGIDWNRVLTPVFVNEKLIRFSTEPRPAGAAPKVTRVVYAPPKQDLQTWQPALPALDKQSEVWGGLPDKPTPPVMTSPVILRDDEIPF